MFRICSPLLYCLFFLSSSSFSLKFNIIPLGSRLGINSRSRCLAVSSEHQVDVISESKSIPSLTLNPPRRIGVVIEPTPFTHVSGYSNRFKEMFKFLGKAGDACEIVTVDDNKEIKAPTSINKYTINNINGFRFPFYKDICLSFDLKGSIYKHFNKFKPDMIHCSAPGFIVFQTTRTAKTLDIPLVMSYHTHLPLYARLYLKYILPGWLSEFIFWQIIKFGLKDADLILVTSPQMKKEFLAHNINKVAVWRKGVDIDKFNPSFKSESMRNKLSGGHPNDPLLVYVGRLGMEKGLDELKHVLKTIPNARLALVGKGPAEPSLRRTFQDMPQVNFVGQLQGDDLSEALASGDVFVMPSTTETLGFVVIESMASGVPVVGARAGGIPSIIDDDKTSLLANPKDPTDFANKVKSLLDDREKLKNMGIAAHKEMQNHGWEAATSHLRNDLYGLAKTNFEEKKKNIRKGFFW